MIHVRSASTFKKSTHLHAASWFWRLVCSKTSGSMFIKKDTRKIPEILADPSDSREYIKLSKRCSLMSYIFCKLLIKCAYHLFRPAEFQGNTSTLFGHGSSEPFRNLRFLNLYDNDLTSIQVRYILWCLPTTLFGDLFLLWVIEWVIVSYLN